MESGYIDRVSPLLAHAGNGHEPAAAALSKLAADFEIETLLSLL